MPFYPRLPEKDDAALKINKLNQEKQKRNQTVFCWRKIGFFSQVR